MAELTQTQQTPGKGKIRSKKQSVKIDMTPMVDLAFLLLTFFILTSTLTNPNALDLTMPDRTTEPPSISADNVLNLVLAENNKVYWWKGLEPKAAVTNFSNEGVRKVLLEQGRDNPKLMILIKPKDGSRYENMVDILDEMSITRMTRYAIVDFTEDDEIRITTTPR
jgi:biopolymer transport protein ExbD